VAKFILAKDILVAFRTHDGWGRFFGVSRMPRRGDARVPPSPDRTEGRPTYSAGERAGTLTSASTTPATHSPRLISRLKSRLAMPLWDDDACAHLTHDAYVRRGHRQAEGSD